VSANKYTLKHHDIVVEYDVDITPGIPALTYADESGPRSFRNGQITVWPRAAPTPPSRPRSS
jgi:hypothetical protein